MCTSMPSVRFINSEECPQDSRSGASRPAKVRGAVLPQEYELARLFEEVENPHSSWKVDTPATEWNGLNIDSYCWSDELPKLYHYPQQEHNMFTPKGYEWSTKGVRKIIINRRRLRGKLNLRYIPYSVTFFHAGHNELTGTVQLDSLPPSLLYLNLSHNQFSGSVDLISLPKSLQILFLENNKFSGNVCFSKLPRDIRDVCLKGNALVGAPDLQNLPPSLTYLGLSSNHFHGYVTFESLPESLSLYLNDNIALYGKLVKECLPWGVYICTTGTNITVHQPPKRDALSKRRVCFDSALQYV